MKIVQRFLVLTLALFIPFVFAGAHSPQRFADNEDESKAKAKIRSDFIDALNVVADNYAGNLSTEGYDKLYKASILGMLHTLDPHSSYFDRKEWEEFQNDQRSRYSGIGAFIGQRNGKVYIMSPFNGTPAYKAGIRYGDQIVEISGESTEGWTQLQVSNKLIGPEGTPVTVKVARAGQAQPLEFKLVRGSVPLPSITNYSMISNGVGYIFLARGFNTTTYDELKSALADLKQQGMTSLILDLRGNRGGLVDQAGKVVNQFLYAGQKIVSLRGRPNVFPPKDLVAKNPNPDDYPLIVLIDRGSASASEIVAGALQDHDRARLVGENSFGKGLVQNIFPMPDGSGLTLTTGHYYTPSGRLIQREYANRSFYDYIFHSDRDATKHTEEKKTDTGRTVYGGGGIDPDVQVKVSPKEFELRRLWFDATFQFARLLVNGQIAGFPEFKIDHAPDHAHRLQANEYQVNDKLMAEFKKYLATYKTQFKDTKIDEARLAKDLEWVRRQIRFEVVQAAYGQEVATQVLYDNDSQLQRAIAEMPKAKEMSERIRGERAALRSNRSGKDE
jgi:carboxyl-terminal processing protease